MLLLEVGPYGGADGGLGVWILVVGGLLVGVRLGGHHLRGLVLLEERLLV